VIFLFKGTWRRTTLLERNQYKPFEYKRLPTEWSSKLLHKRWYRANCSLEQWSKLDVQTVERRSNLSLNEFIEEYDNKNKPVIITDALSHWKAKKEWTKENLIKRFGNLKFKTDEVDYYKQEKLYMMMSDYWTYAEQNHDEDPIYLFDDKFGEREGANELLKDYEILPYFKEDFFSLLEGERPPYRWLVFGPVRSGSPFHVDPYRTSAWNALLVGRKRWALYPYASFPPGIDLEWDDDGNFDHDSPEPVRWYLENYPHIRDPAKKPLECILEAGEVIFIPSGWWHMVLNLEESIAVTQNFCNRQNFDVVCAELEYDDEDDYALFKEKVAPVHPDLKWPTRSFQDMGPFKA